MEMNNTVPGCFVKFDFSVGVFVDNSQVSVSDARYLDDRMCFLYLTVFRVK